MALGGHLFDEDRGEHCYAISAIVECSSLRTPRPIAFRGDTRMRHTQHDHVHGCTVISITERPRRRVFASSGIRATTDTNRHFLSEAVTAKGGLRVIAERLLRCVLATCVATIGFGCTAPPTALDLVPVEVAIVSPSVERCNSSGREVQDARANAESVESMINDEATILPVLEDAQLTGDYREVERNCCASTWRRVNVWLLQRRSIMPNVRRNGLVCQASSKMQSKRSSKRLISSASSMIRCTRGMGSS